MSKETEELVPPKICPKGFLSTREKATWKPPLVAAGTAGSAGSGSGSGFLPAAALGHVQASVPRCEIHGLNHSHRGGSRPPFRGCSFEHSLITVWNGAWDALRMVNQPLTASRVAGALPW